MNRWKWAAAALLFLLIVLTTAWGVRFLRISPLPISAQSASRPLSLNPAHVLLPDREIATYAEEYLMNKNAPVQSWQPSNTDLSNLEANLMQIAALKENVPASDRHIDNPGRYFLQYLAIVQSGNKQIFVNASCAMGDVTSDRRRNHLEVVMDGGTCYWQAWYDPATQKFSNLMINGLA